jgi:hypothetical protein
MTQELIDEIFEKNIGNQTDTVYVTSDDQVHILEEGAKDWVRDKNLPDPTIIPWHKTIENNIRKLGEQHSPLQRIIDMVDYLKFQYLKSKGKQIPTYDDYQIHCDNMGLIPVLESAFDFGVLNVFKRNPDTTDEIYTVDGNVVKAKLIKSYPHTRLFLYEDFIVMTCPTHFVLMGGDVYRLFGPILGSRPKNNVNAKN